MNEHKRKWKFWNINILKKPKLLGYDSLIKECFLTITMKYFIFLLQTLLLHDKFYCEDIPLR